MTAGDVAVALELSTDEMIGLVFALAAAAVEQIESRAKHRRYADEESADGRQDYAAEHAQLAEDRHRDLGHIEAIAAKLPAHCFDSYRDTVAYRCRVAGILL